MPTKTPAKKAAPAKKAVPARKAPPARKAAPAKKAFPAKKAAPAKKAVPVRKAAPAKKAAPVKKAAAVKETVPPKKAAPKLASADKERKSAPKGPQHRVYVIEVERLDPAVDWDFYVGYTNNFYTVRWQKYLDLVPGSVSKFFRKEQVKAIGYRYELMKGWGPYETKELGEIAEGDLALFLEDQGYRTYTNKLDEARKRRANGIPMVGPKVPKKRRVRKKT